MKSRPASIALLFVLALSWGWANTPAAVELHPGPEALRLRLPHSDAESDFQRLEKADSPADAVWRVLARTRPDGSWETLFPEPQSLHENEGASILESPLPVTAAYYRFSVAPARSLDPPGLASRFLTQSTFGATRAEIQALAASGNDFPAWIAAQQQLPPTLHTALWQTAAYQNLQVPVPIHHKGMIWFDAVIRAPDQLRQRMAWALSQILVLSEIGSNERQSVEDWVGFYDIFVRNAFGNYRDVLQEVTLHARMGEYLTYRGNRKAQGAQLPDENYAREVMQLFTIGLWQLHPDGTHLRDASGQSIPTYDNENVLQFARVFTGLDRAPRRPGSDSVNRIDPMIAIESRHDQGEKVLLDGSVIPAGGTTIGDITLLLDHLFAHPNTGPFICRQLIQRLTHSNPSPGYIARVATAFADNGQGERGDLGAVARAILLDPEARHPHYLADDGHGAPREPLLRFTHLCRAFQLSSFRPDNLLRIQNLDLHFGQFPYRSPSVFNFYQPDYQAPGDITSRGLVSPELQIYDDSAALAGSNILFILIFEGLINPINFAGSPEGALDFSSEAALAEDPAALLDHLDLLLTRNTLSAANRRIIEETVTSSIPVHLPLTRARLAVALITLTPEFNVIP